MGSAQFIIVAAYLAAAPLAFWLWFYFRHRGAKDFQPKRIWLILFAGGMAATVPAALIEAFFADKVFPAQLQYCIIGWCNARLEGNALLLLLYFIPVVALSEEFFKYLALHWASWKYSRFVRIKDGIDYGVAVALGFATLENVIYFYPTMQAGDYSALTVDFVVRFFLSTLAHTVYTGLIGYFYAKARFSVWQRGRYIVLGVLIAVMIHGFYNFFVSIGLSVYAELAIGLGLLALIFLNRNPANRIPQLKGVEEYTRGYSREEMGMPRNELEPVNKSLNDLLKKSRSSQTADVVELMDRQKGGGPKIGIG